MTADKREYEDRDNEKLQTSTYDDFEESLSRDDIEIVEAERDPDYLPEGIGADDGYLPRLTEPSYTNPYYIHKDGGGYNLCIKIVGQSCLPNCVGYAFGRYLEAAGILSEANLPRCNAEDWFSMAKSGGFPVGSTPRLGAICVWRKGGFWNSHDGCGHVAVVEKIYESGAILVSQSNYGGARFNMATIRPPYNITGQTFVGFIYNPHLTDTSAKGDATIEEIAKEVIAGMWGNGADRKARLEAAGYSYAAVQAEVERILQESKPTPKKTVAELAKEVIDGEWGNGLDRSKRLMAAGYDYAAVQLEVNRILTRSDEIKVGDKVKVLKAIDYDTGKPFALWYRTYKVMGLFGTRAVIGVNGIVTAAISTDNLEKA